MSMGALAGASLQPAPASASEKNSYLALDFLGKSAFFGLDFL
jgi:hypothetical protein